MNITTFSTRVIEKFHREISTWQVIFQFLIGLESNDDFGRLIPNEHHELRRKPMQKK